MADILTMDAPAPAVGQATARAANEAQRYNRTGDMLKAKMPELVKGAGYANGGNQPLSDPMLITTKAQQAAIELRAETNRGYENRNSVVKSLNGDFLNQFGNLKTALSAPSINEQLQQIVAAVGNPDLTRSFTAGNLGIGSVSGLVPFDLLAPSRLIYPVN
jgi:hypothetical protein